MIIKTINTAEIYDVPNIYGLLYHKNNGFAIGFDFSFGFLAFFCYFFRLGVLNHGLRIK